MFVPIGPGARVRIRLNGHTDFTDATVTWANCAIRVAGIRYVAPSGTPVGRPLTMVVPFERLFAAASLAEQRQPCYDRA